MSKWLAALSLLLLTLTTRAAESWQDALGRMPLPATVGQFNPTNCVEIMLRAFQSNAVFKALIFLPGAADEFYMLGRAKPDLSFRWSAATTSTSADHSWRGPSLLDAVVAVTNQTGLRITQRGPLLLLHTDRDLLEPLIQVEHQPTMERLKQRRFLPYAFLYDRDWEFVQPLLSKRLKARVSPWRYSYDGWHLYRATLAAWNLTGEEALDAIALGCKAAVIVRRGHLDFEPDMRVCATPNK